MPLSVSNLSGFGSGGSNPVTSLAFQTSASAFDTNALTWPTVAAGDIAVIVVAGDGASIATPSGFTQAYYQDDGTNYHAIYYKICTGSESGTAMAGGVGSELRDRVMLVFRPDATPTTVTATNIGHTTMTNLDPAAVVHTSGSDTAPLVVVGFFSADTAITSESFSPASDGSVDASGSFLAAHYKIYNSSPANITADMNDEGRDNMITTISIEVS